MHTPYSKFHCFLNLTYIMCFVQEWEMGLLMGKMSTAVILIVLTIFFFPSVFKRNAMPSTRMFKECI